MSVQDPAFLDSVVAWYGRNRSRLAAAGLEPRLVGPTVDHSKNLAAIEFEGQDRLVSIEVWDSGESDVTSAVIHGNPDPVVVVRQLVDPREVDLLLDAVVADVMRRGAGSLRLEVESLDAWPRLMNMRLAPSFAVLTLEVPGQNHWAGVDLAARTLADAVSTTGHDQLLALVVKLGSIHARSGVGRHRIGKEGPWSFFGADGLAGFGGERCDWSVERGGGLADHYGELLLTKQELPQAFRVATRSDSVVVCGNPGAWSASAFPGSKLVEDGLFESAVALLPSRFTLVASAYGSFDDPSSGIVVVAERPALERLAAAMQTGS